MTLGKRRAEWVLRLLAADCVALLVAFLVAYRLRVALDGPIGRPAAPLGYYLWLLGLIVPMWVGLLAASGAYGMGWTTRSRFWLALRVSVVGLLALTAGLFLGKAEEVNRSVLLLFSGVSAVALWTERGLVLGWLRHSGRRERWSRVALVVGTGDRARGLVTALMRYPEAGWVVRGCLTMDPADPTRSVLDTPVIGSLGDLPELLQGDLVVDEVFFAVSPERLEMLTDALESARASAWTRASSSTCTAPPRPIPSSRSCSACRSTVSPRRSRARVCSGPSESSTSPGPPSSSPSFFRSSSESAPSSG